ncbi:MAG TPA: hypothetical protein VK435_00815 [Thermodesulfovibrionales bacterium]|nr:hypothetical protein [Thermodesulfovibrionales bacterium]
MLVGFNTNISYKDKIYHVQTEDSGMLNPVVVTLLYHEGAILASKKTDYSSVLDDPEFTEKVTKLMKVQHKGMIRDLLAGKYTGNATAKKDEGEASGRVTEKKEEMPEPEPEPEQAQSHSQNIQADAVRAEKDERCIGTSVEEERRQLSNSLDDILLTYIMKREK